jgi:hypothetical protein
VLAACSGKSDDGKVAAANAKLCTTGENDLIQIVAKGTDQQREAGLTAFLVACADACDHKDAASCTVLEKDFMKWTGIMEMPHVDAMCASTKSPSLLKYGCDVMLQTRPK